MITDDGQLALTNFQTRALAVPNAYDLALLGGRGGAKSTAALCAAWVYSQLQAGSRTGFFRQSYPSLHDAVITSIELFGRLDSGARFNKSDLHWTFSNMSSFSFAALADLDLYRRWQGSSLQLAIFEECQQWATPELPDLLLSNLRSGKHPTRAMYIANPGDRGHGWIYERFLKPCPGDLIPFKTENGRETVVLRSTYRDNPHLGDDYLANIAAATKHDPVLLKMWEDGDWSLQGGTYFSECLSYKNLVEWYPIRDFYHRKNWRLFVSLDWGVAAPAVALLLARARDSTYGPDDQVYSRGDIVVVDEVSTNVPNDLNKGDRSTVSEFSDRVKAMCGRWWSAPHRGCGDDAIFAEHGFESGPLASEFENIGRLSIEPAGKGKRTDGWAVVKERMSNAQPAGSRERAAIYINGRCTPYLWETLKLLTHDPRHREDVDTDQADHAADALRYGVVWKQPAPAKIYELI